jgi:hypothetical protein
MTTTKTVEQSAKDTLLPIIIRTCILLLCDVLYVIILCGGRRLSCRKISRRIRREEKDNIVAQRARSPDKGRIPEKKIKDVDG